MSVLKINNVLTALKDEELNPSDEGNGLQAFKIVDRFTVDVPYTSGHLKIRVVYNLLSPEEPPDFIPLDAGLWDVELDYEELRALWRPGDVHCVYDMLMKIKWAYGEKLKREVEGCKDYLNPSIGFMYDVVKQHPGYEVKILNKDYGAETLLVSLPLDLQVRSETCSKSIMMHIKGFTNKTFSAEIEYPKWLVSMQTHTVAKIFKSESQNPVWDMNNLPKFLEYAKQYLAQRARYAVNSRDTKQAFLQSLCDGSLGVPLEVDTTEFSRLTLHYELPGKNASDIIQVTVRLSDNFPVQPPSFKLRNQKILSASGGLKERISSVSGKIWNPEFEIQQLVHLFRQCVLQEIEQFSSVMYKNED